VRAVPRLCKLYPGIYLITEEKTCKNLSQGRIASIYDVSSIPLLLVWDFCICFVMFATIAAKAHCGNLVAANDVMASVKTLKVWSDLCIISFHINILLELYAFFWVITHHLEFICRRLGTHCSIFIGLLMKMEQCVPKRRHINSRRQVITQKKAYNIQNTAKAWNQDPFRVFPSQSCTNYIIITGNAWTGSWIAVGLLPALSHVHQGVTTMSWLLGG
jgi:hypothetical protein